MKTEEAFKQQLELSIPLSKVSFNQYFNGDIPQIGDNVLFGLFSEEKENETTLYLKTLTEKHFPLLEVIDMKGKGKIQIPILKIKE